MALTCLSTLVGLSQVEYDCFTDDAPDGFDVSTSGYYLTEPEHGLEIIGTCETAGWAMLERALASGIRDFKTDLAATLRNDHASNLSPFSGLIGQLKFSGVTSPTKAFIGHEIWPKYVKGAKLVIKGVRLGLNQSGSFTLRFRSTDGTFTGVDKTVTAVANQFATTTFAEAVELPFHTRADVDFDELKYYVTIERGTAKPLNNVFSCCGNKTTWDTHALVQGIQSDDADGTNYGTTGSAQGIVLDAYMACDELDWVCELPEHNGIYLQNVAAKCIQMKGAASAIGEMIGKNAVNICTLYNLEGLAQKRDWLLKQYAERVAWLSQNLPKQVTDCWTCKPTQKFYKTQKLV